MSCQVFTVRVLSIAVSAAPTHRWSPPCADVCCRPARNRLDQWAPALPVQAAVTAKPNLAPTPPMGWNSWNTFGCNINEQLIRDTADAMVSSGMAAAGYKYVNIDDCWMAPPARLLRTARPRTRAGSRTGSKAIADYVHGKGLKLGIYSSAGSYTCAGLPASLHHETLDAQTWASWGVDLLKYDNCGEQDGIPAQTRYKTMGDALVASGRNILFSICEWGSNQPLVVGSDAGGHMWRTTGDIANSCRA